VQLTVELLSKTGRTVKENTSVGGRQNILLLTKTQSSFAVYTSYLFNHILCTTNEMAYFEHDFTQEHKSFTITGFPLETDFVVNIYCGRRES